jgi:EpsI family protein
MSDTVSTEFPDGRQAQIHAAADTERSCDDCGAPCVTNSNSAPEPGSENPKPPSYARTLIVSVVMVLTFFLLKHVNHSEDIYPNKPLSSFPKQIENWSGIEHRFEDRVYEIVGVDDSFLADYTTPDGRMLNLYIGFYQSQREGDLIHSPKHCMPGAGWKIAGTAIETIEVPDTPYKKIDVLRLNLKNGIHEKVVLYWYQSRGRIISSEYWEKIYLVVDSITRHRTDGSFVRLIAPVNNGNGDEAARHLKDFVNLVFPVLLEFLPA